MNAYHELPGAGNPIRSASIGLFDSGVGGLSILRAMRQRLPNASMVYVGDVAYSPYGDSPAHVVIERSERIVEWLVSEGAMLIVVACNTATVLAIKALRARWPRVVFVGVEPGVRPGAAISQSRRIAVLATAATAASDRLRHLIERYADGAYVHVQACPGLVDWIERGVIDGPELFAVLEPYCDAVRAAQVDTVILGCTHYAFVESTIRSLLGQEITVIDTAPAIADRVVALWAQSLPTSRSAPSVRAFSTGSAVTMRLLISQFSRTGHITAEVLTMIPSTLPG